MGNPAAQTIAFAIWGPIAREDLPGLSDRVCALLRGSGATTAFCDVTGVEPDAVTVDALARLQMAAARLGCRVRLRNASPALCELVDFMGLRDVLTTDADGVTSHDHASHSFEAADSPSGSDTPDTRQSP